MNVFVVVSAAIPAVDKMNSLAVKVSAVCSRASRAEEIARMIRETEPRRSLVYGLDCNIHTSVVECSLGESVQGDDVYVITTAAIPRKRHEHPVQSNVRSVHATPQKAEEVFQEIMKRPSINIKGMECEVHATIIPIKLDRS